MVKINCASRCANVDCPRNMDNENYDKTRPLAYLENNCKNFKKVLDYKYKYKYNKSMERG